MKKLFIMGIALILMCSVAFSLYSCEIEDDSDKHSSQTENESLFETNSKSNSNSPNDTNTEAEEDDTQQRFSSFDELLLAINDIDTFCEVVKENGAGQPIDKDFVKRHLDELVKYPFAYIDNYKSFHAYLYDSILHATFITEDETIYAFSYNLTTGRKGVEVDRVFTKLKIGDQFVELEKKYNASFPTLRGLWKNEDTCVSVSVVNYQKLPVDLESFYTINLLKQ